MEENYIILRKNHEILLVECKRYNTPKVTRPDIQKFHSAMIDMNAKKGLLITTGEFTKPAIEYTKNKAIEVIDGDHLIAFINKSIRPTVATNDLTQTEIQ